jgi:short-subunit dehydrogenase
MLSQPKTGTMNKTALITGATTGIGFEFTKLLAADGYNLVLIARDEQKLRQIATSSQTKFNVSVKIYPKDLSVTSDAEDVVRQIRQEFDTIDVLVNNAGFGISGAFVETDLQREVEMIQLNVVSLVIFTKLFAREMAQRGHGKILNVASTAAFQPGPFMAIYYATKAFVLSFSEGLAEELNDSGVTVTALCPGPTATQFSKRAELEKSRLFQGGLIPVLDPATVAKMGYDGLSKGQRIVIPGLMNKIGVLALRFIPRRLVTQLTKRLNK